MHSWITLHSARYLIALQFIVVIVLATFVGVSMITMVLVKLWVAGSVARCLCVLVVINHFAKSIVLSLPVVGKDTVGMRRCLNAVMGLQ